MRDEEYYEDMRADDYEVKNCSLRKCPYCNGRGYEHPGPGDTRAYRCPDCGGSGFLSVCNICVEDVYGEYCENCYAQCKVCEEIYPADELKDGICEACKEFLAEEEKNKKQAVNA